MHARGFCQFTDDIPSPSVDQLLDGLGDPTPYPDVHRQQLVDGVDLDPHPRTAIVNRPLDRSTMSTDPGHDPNERKGHNTQPTQPDQSTHHSRHHSPGCAGGQLADPELSKPIRVAETLEQSRLLELEHHGSVTTGVENPTNPIRQRPENRTEEPGNRIGPNAAKVRPVGHDIGRSAKTRPADHRIRPHSGRQPPRRWNEERDHTGQCHAAEERGEHRTPDQISNHDAPSYDLADPPRTRFSWGSLDRRLTSTIPNPLSIAPNKTTTNPAADA